jgi:hypothetical protein
MLPIVILFENRFEKKDLQFQICFFFIDGPVQLDVHEETSSVFQNNNDINNDNDSVGESTPFIPNLSSSSSSSSSSTTIPSKSTQDVSSQQLPLMSPRRRRAVQRTRFVVFVFDFYI